MEPSARHALYGWSGVAAAVLIYDIWALSSDRETLSRAFRRACRKNRVGPLVVLGWLALSWHLLIGDKAILPAHLHNRYEQYHPFWYAHSVIVERGAKSRIMGKPASLPSPSPPQT